MERGTDGRLLAEMDEGRFSQEKKPMINPLHDQDRYTTEASSLKRNAVALGCHCKDLANSLSTDFSLITSMGEKYQDCIKIIDSLQDWENSWVVYNI